MNVVAAVVHVSVSVASVFVTDLDMSLMGDGSHGCAASQMYSQSSLVSLLGWHSMRKNGYSGD
jgi:hypothetical protein